MPLVEIDDVVFNALRDNSVKFTDRSAELAPTAQAAAAWQKIVNGSETRGDALRLFKKAFPDIPVPEIDARAPVDEAISSLRKEFDDYKAGVEKEKDDARQKNREADALDTVSKGRSWLRREKKLDDESVSAVETMMQELGIPNYEVAHSHWAAQQPKQPDLLPSSTIGRSLDWFKAQDNQPDHALMLKDPIAWRRQEIVKTLQGIRSGEIAAA
jgi:hypothetical protein